METSTTTATAANRNANAVPADWIPTELGTTADRVRW